MQIKLLLSLGFFMIYGCAINQKDNSLGNFFKIVGASRDSEIRPCSDYASTRDYMGTPYYIRVPETGNVITRHEGIDFCARAGADVLAPASGTIVSVVEDNPHRGGSVTIKTSILYDHYGTGNLTYTLHVQTLHIRPRSNLSVGDKVSAGDVIGLIQAPNRPEIGPRPHVHLSTGANTQTWTLHTDPNQFWQRGSGRVSCFRPDDPPSDIHLVAPVRC